MTQEVQVPRLVTPRQDFCVTPGRRRYNQYMKKTLEEINSNTEVRELNFNEPITVNAVPVVTSPFPSLFLLNYDDETTLENLKVYLQQRLAKRNEPLEKLNECKNVLEFILRFFLTKNIIDS